MSTKNDLRSVCFDAQQPHYLDQFLPVYRELERRHITCEILFHADKHNIKHIRRLIRKEGVQAQIVYSNQQAIAYHHINRPTWILFGDECEYITKLPKPRRTCKTAQLYHNIGVKNDIYKPQLMEMGIRFLEGPYYARELRKRYPDKRMLEVGYAKLDPMFSDNTDLPYINLEELGLQHDRKTLFYAPTFDPNSISQMPEEWPDDYADYNIIIKPHPLTCSDDKYRSDRNKIAEWTEFENVYVIPPSELSILPYMAATDLLIADGSSTLFEFAAQDKPMIWLDFFHLPWSYRGPLNYRLQKTLDHKIFQYANMCPHASDYKALKSVIKQQLSMPDEYTRRRKGYSRELLGKADGKVSERISDFLFPETKGMSVAALPSPGTGNAVNYGY